MRMVPAGCLALVLACLFNPVAAAADNLNANPPPPPPGFMSGATSTAHARPAITMGAGNMPRQIFAITGSSFVPLDSTDNVIYRGKGCISDPDGDIVTDLQLPDNAVITAIYANYYNMVASESVDVGLYSTSTGTGMGIALSATTNGHSGYGYDYFNVSPDLTIRNEDKAYVLRANTGTAWLCAVQVFYEGPNHLASNIVYSGPINHPVATGLSGTWIDWFKGRITDTNSSGYSMNLWAYDGKINFSWQGTSAGALNGPFYALLGHGETIGPSDSFSQSADPYFWRLMDGDAYFGFRFSCSHLLHPPTPATCYGYLHLDVTSPGGIPAVIKDFAWDRTGAPITTP